VHRTTGELAILLRHREKLDAETTDLLLEWLATGNRAAHCQFVTRQELSSAINMAHWFLRDQPTAAMGGAP
jgi:hypothetical protein